MDLRLLGKAVLDDARFEPAAERLCADIVSHYAAQPKFSKLFGNRTQVLVVFACYHLHPVITVADLLRALPAGEATRRRVNDHIQSLLRIGALVPAPEQQDQRSNEYSLSAEFLAWVGKSVEIVVLPALPFVEQPPNDINDPDTRKRWIDQWMAARATAPDPAKFFPKIEYLMGLRVGNILLCELMRRVYAADKASLPRFSRREIAARFGVSRTHVIELLSWLDAEGWIEAGPDGPRPTAALMTEARLWHALQLAVAARLLAGPSALQQNGQAAVGAAAAE
jgi:hypothetical protein